MKNNEKLFTRFKLSHDNYKMLLSLRKGRFITRKKICHELGVSEIILDKLLNAGFFKLSSRYILLKDYNEFKNFLFENQSSIDKTKINWISIRNAVLKHRLKGICMHKILQLIWDKKLDYRIKNEEVVFLTEYIFQLNN